MVRLRQALTILLLESGSAGSRSRAAESLVRTLAAVHAANERSGLLPHTEFYVDAGAQPLRAVIGQWSALLAGFCEIGASRNISSCMSPHSHMVLLLAVLRMSAAPALGTCYHVRRISFGVV